MKTKIFFILICNLFMGELSVAQNITNTLGTTGIFTIKDASNNFLTLSQSSGLVGISKNLSLTDIAGSQTGILYKGADRFLHTYRPSGSDGYNTFLGLNSGNFSMLNGGTSFYCSYNTAIGYSSLSSLTNGCYNTAVGYQSLYSNTTGYQNTALGNNSLYSNTTGNYNTAVGLQSLNSNTTGTGNIAVGFNSLQHSTTGASNVAVGTLSLQFNTTGYQNTALGNNSLNFNTAGNYNTAVGSVSLNRNTTGNSNTAIGYTSLMFNSTGKNNSALGYQSLLKNTTGSSNTALGDNSLYNNTTASSNTAIGDSSMYSNTTGFQNTAVGNQSLSNNTIGNTNTSLGFNSLLSNSTGSQNTSVGHHSLQFNSTGNYNTALGFNAGSTVTTGANLTLIGIDANPSSPTVNDQITLGNVFVTSLRCNVTTITSLSDMRDKKNITDLTLGLDFITKLKPRQFNWDKREWYDNNVSDGSKMKDAPTAGFIAQELDEVQTTSNAEWVNLVLKDNPEKWEATPGNLLPIMVKAIQELKTENDELKEKLSKYEQMQNVLAVEIDKLKSNNADTKEVKLTEK